MNITLKKISYNERLSEETAAFAAGIYIDGKKAGDASNHGHGGPTDIHIYDPDIRKAADAYCSTLPPLELGYGLNPIPMTLEHLIDGLLNDHLEAKEKKKWCKKDIVFRLKGDPSGSYRTIKKENGVFSQRQRDYMQRHYGDKIEEILNDVLGV
jgi:lambda repressor-like predicted transcriptional regulator